MKAVLFQTYGEVAHIKAFDQQTMTALMSIQSGSISLKSHFPLIMKIQSWQLKDLATDNALFKSSWLASQETCSSKCPTTTYAYRPRFVSHY